MTRICEVDGCDEKHSAKGFCEVHYRRWKNTGITALRVREKRWPNTTCRIDGCEKKTKTKGLCSMHYARLLKSGTTDPTPYRQSFDIKECSVDGCNGKKKALGLCIKHYERMIRRGSLKTRREEEVWVEPGKKRCPQCSDVKPFADFYKDASKQSGMETYCKKCKSANQKDYLERNPDVRYKRRKEYKEWHEANKEKRQEYQRKYHAKHKEKLNERARKYVAERKEHYRALELERRKNMTDEDRRILAEKRRAHRASMPEEKRQEERARNRKYARDLHDIYVRRFFTERFGVKNPPQELIELKRVQLKIHRAMKNEHS